MGIYGVSGTEGAQHTGIVSGASALEIFQGDFIGGVSIVVMPFEGMVP
jgi:hypothetical protein